MSARLRLTLSYAAFLVLAAAAMLLLLLYVLRFVPDAPIPSADGFVPSQGDLLAALWPRALQVTAVLLVVGLVGGWYLAGWMLRPLQRLGAVAERVADGSLDSRVRLDRHDEFGRLGDAFDSMLDTLQAAFAEQERFTANVSHELRTPYAISRVVLDVALADPTRVDVPQLLGRLDATTRRGTEAVEALLTIATLDHLVEIERRPVDVAELVARVVDEAQPLAAEARVAVATELGEGDFDGDEVLVGQLIMNLVVNGIRHNDPAGGRMLVTAGTLDDDRVEVRVRNTGPVIPPDVARTLSDAFVRGAGRPTTPDGRAIPAVEGSGLGLTIVARVARLHAAELTIDPQPGGGLDVRVVFPAPR
ncbi:sensor histidine kinase [Clavibacter sp. Sh2141]|uniref:sensor histidine kinase n=1 Tax=unclassified Clavibacter TaxID=2626594 RepID=UPI0039BC28DC